MDQHKVTCPECGEVHVASSDIHVHHYRLDESWTCTFKCPVCKISRVQSIKQQVAEVLGNDGIRVSSHGEPSPVVTPNAELDIEAEVRKFNASIFKKGGDARIWEELLGGA